MHRRSARVFTTLIATIVLAATVGAQQSSADSARQRSGIAGVVRDTLGHPIASARILVEGSKLSAASDDSGRFDLRGLRSGSNGFVITKIGYTPVSFEARLLPDSIVVLAIRMRAVQTLNTVNVNAVRTNRYLDQIGFTERRSKAWGFFLPPERIDSLQPMVTTSAQLFREVPGLIVECGTPATNVATIGGVFNSTFDRHATGCRVNNTISECRPTLIIDGVSHGTEQIDDLGLTPNAIAAIEVYRSGATVPAEFRGMAGCGALIVWTKLRIP